MKHIWSLFLLSGLILLACKKEPLEIPESEIPVFRADGTIDGEPFSIVAGDDGAYMYTDSRKERGVDVHGGKLSNESFSVEMEIYDGNIDVTGFSSVSGIPETLEFVQYQAQPLIVLNKNLFINASVIESIDWTIDDSITTTNSYQIYEPGKYSVCGVFHFIDGSEKSICEDLTIGYKRNAYATVDMVENEQGVLDGWISPEGSDIESIRWYLNNSLFCYYPSWSTQISDDFQNIEVHVQYANGAQKVMRTIFDGANYERSVQSLSIFEGVVEEELERDFDLRLKIKDNGTEYTSDFADNSESSLNIINISHYGTNEAGNETYKIEAEISAKVQESQNSSPKVINFTTTFGFEVK